MRSPAIPAAPKASAPVSIDLTGSSDEVMRQVFPDGVPSEFSQQLAQAHQRAEAAGTVTLTRNIEELQMQIDQFPSDVREQMAAYIARAREVEAEASLAHRSSQPDFVPDIGEDRQRTGLDSLPPDSDPAAAMGGGQSARGEPAAGRHGPCQLVGPCQPRG